MAHLIGIFATKVGAFIQRFLTEVIASVVTTACVAAATTLYIHAMQADANPGPAKAATADLGQLLSPVVEPGAPAFVITEKVPAGKPEAVAMPPARVKPAIRQVGAEAQPPEGRPAVEEANAAVASKEPARDVFAMPVIVADAPKVFDIGPDEVGSTGPSPADSLLSPNLPNGAAEKPVPASFQPQRAEERRLLGLPVPDVLPSNDDVVAGVKGFGAAVGRLLP